MNDEDALFRNKSSGRIHNAAVDDDIRKCAKATQKIMTGASTGLNWGSIKNALHP